MMNDYICLLVHLFVSVILIPQLCLGQSGLSICFDKQADSVPGPGWSLFGLQDDGCFNTDDK